MPSTSSLLLILLCNTIVALLGEKAHWEDCKRDWSQPPYGLVDIKCWHNSLSSGEKREYYGRKNTAGERRLRCLSWKKAINERNRQSHRDPPLTIRILEKQHVHEHNFCRNDVPVEKLFPDEELAAKGNVPWCFVTENGSPRGMECFRTCDCSDYVLTAEEKERLSTAAEKSRKAEDTITIAERPVSPSLLKEVALLKRLAKVPIKEPPKADKWGQRPLPPAYFKSRKIIIFCAAFIVIALTIGFSFNALYRIFQAVRTSVQRRKDNSAAAAKKKDNSSAAAKKK